MKLKIVDIPGGVSLRETSVQYSADGRLVGKIYSRSDADRILMACNTHGDLIAALQAILNRDGIQLHPQDRATAHKAIANALFGGG